MATESLLKIKIKKEAPPTHAWNWNAFNELIESDEVIAKRVLNPVSDVDLLSDEEANLSWDYSPEQFEINSSISDQDLNSALSRRKLFSSDSEQEKCSLTSSTSDDQVFPTASSSANLSRKFKRTRWRPKHRFQRTTMQDLGESEEMPAAVYGDCSATITTTETNAN